MGDQPCSTHNLPLIRCVAHHSTGSMSSSVGLAAPHNTSSPPWLQLPSHAGSWGAGSSSCCTCSAPFLPQLDLRPSNAVLHCMRTRVGGHDCTVLYNIATEGSCWCMQQSCVMQWWDNPMRTEKNADHPGVSGSTAGCENFRALSFYTTVNRSTAVMLPLLLLLAAPVQLHKPGPSRSGAD